MESNRDQNRPHPITNNDHHHHHQQQQQLFLCFTSRLSSSSSSAMKISKSILSPGRSAREISLSSSLSRRLKTNGSLKGAQSPMFPVATGTARKKTGVGFENPEPSSPKVTCIGQVRVKSKKKKTSHHHHHHHRSSNSNNIRSRSRSQRRSGGDSFRRIDTSAGVEDGNNGLKRQSSTSYRNRDIELESSHRHGHNNQKWVHIPVTICDSLRSFGSDFNCFLPCKSSSCLSNKQHHHQQRRQREAEKQLGCGSVLARWLVTVQDGEVGEKGRRQIELVVGGVDDDDNDEELCGRRSYRKRNVMEDIDIKEIERNLNEKVGSLDRRDEIVESGRLSICVPPKNALLLMRCGSDPVKLAALANRFWQPPEKEEHVNLQDEDDNEEHVRGADRDCETEQNASDNREVEESVSSESEMKCEDDNISSDKFVTEEMYHDVIHEESSSADMEVAVPVNGADQDAEVAEMMDDAVDDFEEAEQLLTSPSSEQEQEDRGDIMLPEQSKQVVDYSDEEMNTEKERSSLPDCLLMMMCEPKLSMEVSQETWVCTTDFIRCQPSREVSKKTKKCHDGGSGGGGGEELSKRVSIHCKPPTAPPRKPEENPQLIPHRSSCSYPRHESAREALYNLTRCKSEPRRAAAKLAAAGTTES